MLRIWQQISGRRTCRGGLGLGDVFWRVCRTVFCDVSVSISSLKLQKHCDRERPGRSHVPFDFRGRSRGRQIESCIVVWDDILFPRGTAMKFPL